MVSTVFVIVAIIFRITKVKGGDDIPERKCATFFLENSSPENMLYDFDQLGDLYQNYRRARDEMNNPASVEIDEGCQVQVCQLEYFGGSCQDIINSNVTSVLEHNFDKTTEIKSARCTCQRECSCQKIFIPKDLSKYPILGRGYFEGGCNTCDSEYVALRSCDPSPFWQQQQRKLETVILRSGCNLTVYSEGNFTGEQRIITGSVFQDAIELPSYKISCSDSKFVALEKPPMNSSFPRKLVLPEWIGDFYLMLGDDDSLKWHPGYNLLLMSNSAGTSLKNGYVVVIGTHEAYRAGFPQCQSGLKNRIGECHIPVSLNMLGLSTQLRVITAPIAEGTQQVKYKLKTSLGEFLSKHKELKGVIPNAVILYQELTDDSSNVTSSALQVKLQALNTLRERLLPKELFSNLVVLLDASKRKSLDTADAARYNSKYETEINKALNPSWETQLQPIAFCWTSDWRSQTYFVNGNAKLFNGEFWPRNLAISLAKNSIKLRDHFGAAILKTAIHDNGTPHGSIKQVNDKAVDDREIKQSPGASCALSPYEPVESTKEMLLGLEKTLKESSKAKSRKTHLELRVTTLEMELALLRKLFLELSKRIKMVKSGNQVSRWIKLELRVKLVETELMVLRKELLELIERVKLGIFKLLATVCECDSEILKIS